MFAFFCWNEGPAISSAIKKNNWEMKKKFFLTVACNYPGSPLDESTFQSYDIKVNKHCNVRLVHVALVAMFNLFKINSWGLFRLVLLQSSGFHRRSDSEKLIYRSSAVKWKKVCMKVQSTEQEECSDSWQHAPGF